MRKVTITAVLTHRVSARLHTPFVTSLRRTSTVDSLVVEIRDARRAVRVRRGAAGVGGHAASPWTARRRVYAATSAHRSPVATPTTSSPTAGTPATASSATTAPRPPSTWPCTTWPPAGAGCRWQRCSAARSGSVTTDVTISAGAPDAMAAAARDRVAEGFTVLKMKVGADPGTDHARVAAVRAAVGGAVRIRLDANQGWTPRQAVRVISAMEDAGLDVELVEQPVAHWDLDGLAWVSERVHTPVLADEAVFGVRDLIEVIRRRAADMVNVKLAKCGGLEPARTLLGLAEAHGVGTLIGSMMETSDRSRRRGEPGRRARNDRGLRPRRRLVARRARGHRRHALRRRADRPVRGRRTRRGRDRRGGASGCPRPACPGRARQPGPGQESVPASEGTDQAGPYEVAVSVTGLWFAADSPRPLDAALTDALPRPVAWLSAQGPTRRRELWGRLESQLLLGERVIVHEVCGGWARVSAPSQPSSRCPDGYPGFVPAHHLEPAAEATGRRIVVRQPVTRIRTAPGARVALSSVSFATILRLVDVQRRGMVAQPKPAGGSRCTSPAAEPAGCPARTSRRSEPRMSRRQGRSWSTRGGGSSASAISPADCTGCPSTARDWCTPSIGASG